ncbi:aldo/keto reductase [Longispora sp. NPDC051575]|uniref:aldo/keto reductase n=1 Tax=Longispora sp. NPDC051575 TaxID=3154943 RepID=UPI00341BEA55
MTYRPLGNSGLMVSVVGLGCNNFGRPGSVTEGVEGTRAVIDTAIDAGITLFDTADIYGTPGRSESLMGEVLGNRRDRIVLATKFGMDMQGLNGPDWGARGSRRYVRLAVEASLRRLRTDWIDLYQYHEPDGVTPVEETLAALDELVVEGKVRYIGNSNFSGWQVAQAEYVARGSKGARFISAQNEYSLLHRAPEAELVPACVEFGVGILPYFPLKSGLLTGKYSRDETPTAGRLANRPHVHAGANWDLIDKIATFAAERGVGLLDVAIGGLAAQPAVSSVIAGATSPAQVVANVAAGAWTPAPEELAALNAL